MEPGPRTIMRVLLAFAALSAALLFDVPASRAYVGNAPWCALINTGFGNVEEDCQYRSIEECRQVVLAGNRGFCNLNPRWNGWYDPAPRPRRHGKRRVRQQ
jgi:hypothetical protein